MTTIACNTKEMACDLQITLNGNAKAKCYTKIYKIDAHERHYPEDFIIGLCGSASEAIEVVDYYQRPELYKSLPKTRDTSGLVLTRSGKIYVFDTPNQWMCIAEKFTALGSGGNVALGALLAGASPKNAIIAASKIDPFTGLGTKTLSF